MRSVLLAVLFGSAALSQTNPLLTPSTLPFQAPPFDKIKESDYQPAIEAGIDEARREIDAIANDPAPPTFENTFVAMEKSGQTLHRVMQTFSAIASANTNPGVQKLQQIESPKLAALEDARTLNPKLFPRVSAIYKQRDSLHLDPQAKRLVELTYEHFVHAGANLSDADKVRMKQINEQLSGLSITFGRKLLAATKAGAFTTTDRNALAGLSEAELRAAALAAEGRKVSGYTIPLQNTTQQPVLQSLTNRSTREAIFADSWTRAERGGENDTTSTVQEIAKLRAEKARLLGLPNFAAWKLQDQMAKTPAAALRFMDALVPAATAKANEEAKDIQAVIDAQKGGFQVAPFDWEFYSEQVRKAKYDVDEAAVRPYLELNRVLIDGVFYAATKLYGITFKERKDIPVYHPDVRVFEVSDNNGKPLALFYCDYFKRDNKQGGAWTSSFVTPSKLMGTLPVEYNVGNVPKPAPGEPALISYDDARMMFHEFGHALHGMFASVDYPTLAGSIPRDFVEFPSQFNEHWMTEPAVFTHFARHYKTGEPMPAALVTKLRKADTFNQGYSLTEMLAASELDMQWHLLPADAPLQPVDSFEQAALEKTKLALKTVPPRYRTTYFSHIWSSGYSAGYYAYLWSEMLDDDAWVWFNKHGGLTRENGDRFRGMVLSQGSKQDFEAMYEAWRGAPPSTEGLIQQRGLR